MAEGAINKALRVLRVVSENSPATLTTLSGLTSLTPPTLLRTLRILADEGYVEQDGDRKWRPTRLLWRLGCAVKDSVGFGELTQRILRDLVLEIDETVVFAAYEEGRLTYAAQAEPSKPVRAHVPLGGNYAALDTTTGHAIMAWLAPQQIEQILSTQGKKGFDFSARRGLVAELRRVASRGFASGTGDRWPGVWGAAAPVFDHSAAPIGAIGVSIPSKKVPAQAHHAEQAVVDAAQRLTIQLGGPSRPPAPKLPDPRTGN
ncbi:IclR family transcriptional regulator [Cumulibacter soli]|uniref:IclR family transcriptional regulator n=1 Tax=Cumulibacter soli TaxID=2546344 RepID=UPI0010689236|nr:IclR family transcriptional regulator [Cumulibacter soli]